MAIVKNLVTGTTYHILEDAEIGEMRESNALFFSNKSRQVRESYEVYRGFLIVKTYGDLGFGPECRRGVWMYCTMGSSNRRTLMSTTAGCRPGSDDEIYQTVNAILESGEYWYGFPRAPRPTAEEIAG